MGTCYSYAGITSNPPFSPRRPENRPYIAGERVMGCGRSPLKTPCCESCVITIIIEHLWESVGLVSLFAVTSISDGVSPKTSPRRKSECQMLCDGSSMRAKLYEGQAVF